MSVNVVQQSNLKEVSGTGNIKTVSVNGTNVQPDANKNVNISVPTKTSQLTNDSAFASPEELAKKANAYKNTVNFVEFANKIGTAIPDGVGGISVNGPIGLSNGAVKALTVDQTPISGSNNLISSKAVYTALQNISGGASAEKGTWTPTDAGGTLTGTGRTLTGRYIKVGNIVHLYFGITTTSSSPSISNAMYFWLKGFPFTPQALVQGQDCVGIGVVMSSTTALNKSGIFGFVGGAYGHSGIIFRPPHGYSGITLQAGESAYGFATYASQ